MPCQKISRLPQKKHPLYSTQTKNLSCKLEENGRLSYMRVESYLNHIIITGYYDKIDGCLHTWKKLLYIILPAILHDLLVFTSITITYLPTQAPSEKACGHSLTTLRVRGIKVICFHQSPHTHTHWWLSLITVLGQFTHTSPSQKGLIGIIHDLLSIYICWQRC